VGRVTPKARGEPDNQGLRYRQANWLLALGACEELDQLFAAHAGEGNAPGFGYTRALAAFARHGADAPARALLTQARKLNPHIPAYLTHRKKLPRQRPAYTVFGEASEAVDYAAGAGKRQVPTPIQPGTQEVDASVDVVYMLATSNTDKRQAGRHRRRDHPPARRSRRLRAHSQHRTLPTRRFCIHEAPAAGSTVCAADDAPALDWPAPEAVAVRSWPGRRRCGSRRESDSRCSSSISPAAGG